MKTLFALILGTASLLPLHQASSADAFADTAQICWVLGKYDDTVYFAEAFEREDRSQSFGELLKISGVEHNGVKCVRVGTRSHAAVRANLLARWRAAELETVNTTFMSDDD